MSSITVTNSPVWNGELDVDYVVDRTNQMGTQPVWVRVDLNQNGQLVFTETLKASPDTGSLTFTPLMSLSYQGGAADGTISMFWTDQHGKSHPMLSVPVSVGA